jgi:hypothetical protein
MQKDGHKVEVILLPHKPDPDSKDLQNKIDFEVLANIEIPEHLSVISSLKSVEIATTANIHYVCCC